MEFGQPQPPKRNTRTIIGIVVASCVAAIAMSATVGLVGWAVFSDRLRVGPDSAMPASASDAPSQDSSSSQGSPANPAPTCVDYAYPSGRTGNDLQSGPVSIPGDHLPNGWRSGYFGLPDVSAMAGMAVTRPAGSTWAATLSIGTLAESMPTDPQTAARAITHCLTGNPGYASTGPLPVEEHSVSTTEYPAITGEHVVLRATLASTNAPVPGDDLIVVVIAADPPVFGLGTSPVGDRSTYTEIDTALSAMRLTASDRA